MGDSFSCFALLRLSSGHMRGAVAWPRKKIRFLALAHFFKEGSKRLAGVWRAWEDVAALVLQEQRIIEFGCEA